MHRTYDKRTSAIWCEEIIMDMINMVINFIEFISLNNLVVYKTWLFGERIGDPAYHEKNVPFYRLSWKRQYKLAERMLREYKSQYWDDWSYADQCSANPYWVLAFLRGEKYAKMIVNGEESIDDEEEEYFYDEEEDNLLGIRTRISA